MKVPGAMLKVLTALNEDLESMQENQDILDYGFELSETNPMIVKLDDETLKIKSARTDDDDD